LRQHWPGSQQPETWKPALRLLSIEGSAKRFSIAGAERRRHPLERNVAQMLDLVRVARDVDRHDLSICSAVVGTIPPASMVMKPGSPSMIAYRTRSEGASANSREPGVAFHHLGKADQRTRRGRHLSASVRAGANIVGKE
jgi:hypothetical protein